MSGNIMCRKCGHSMAFHAFYGCCEAPVAGKKLYNRCGCNWTTYNEINALRKQLEELSTNISVILDCVDYSAGNCKANEPVGGVLPKAVINNAKKALAEIERIGGEK